MRGVIKRAKFLNLKDGPMLWYRKAFVALLTSPAAVVHLRHLLVTVRTCRVGEIVQLDVHDRRPGGEIIRFVLLS